MPTAHTAPAPLLESRIWLIRGHKVILDADLTELYQVTTGNLNLAVRRNEDRFPNDFMFQLTKEEFENLRLQIARSSWGGRRHPPYAFTEQGIFNINEKPFTIVGITPPGFFDDTLRNKPPDFFLLVEDGTTSGVR